MARSVAQSLFLVAGALLLVPAAFAGPIPASGSTASLLQDAVNGAWRPAADKARDQYRHPAATLEFFGMRPDMTVIELSAGGGWYTRILAPFLYAHGHLLEPMSEHDQRFASLLASDPAVFGHVERGPLFEPFTKNSQHLSLGPNDSADMVVTFRNMHDYHDAGNMAGVLRAAYNVLKPGGVFGMTDNRALPYADAAVVDHTLHRNVESYMIEAGLKAGFRLAGVSQVNANPRDPLNILIFKMSPILAHDTPSERAKMEAIGEPDAMTLKFVKP
ncbi:MAG: class I SAM-dependent methyltransferase [Gammaproteobacteria bacterium]